MKTKNIVGTLVVTNIIAVLIILVVLIASKKQQNQSAESNLETSSPSAPEAVAPPVQPEAPVKPEDKILPIVEDVLQETDSLYDRTLVAYKRKINQQPPYWGKYIAGYAEAKEGRYPEAIEILQRRLQTSPNDLENLYTLAWTYAKRGDLTQAEQICNQCLQIDPKFARAALLKGWIK
ncbi:MAG: tetratricopeptide repeat protein, partial [Planctomycetota bacterium]